MCPFFSSLVELTQLRMHITMIVPLDMSMVIMACQIYVFHNVLFMVFKKTRANSTHNGNFIGIFHKLAYTLTKTWLHRVKCCGCMSRRGFFLSLLANSTTKNWLLNLTSLLIQPGNPRSNNFISPYLGLVVSRQL